AYAARSLLFFGRRASPFSLPSPLRASVVERREAPGARRRTLADHDAVRRAPLRRRAHPSDAGVRRLPALHRGAQGGTTFFPPPVGAAADFACGPAHGSTGKPAVLFTICSLYEACQGQIKKFLHYVVGPPRTLSSLANL